jgi:trimethylamine--corrinoid protein Co-methyltransferase
MIVKGASMEKIERLKILSEDELIRIHENSLKILENTGLSISSEKVLKICRECGLDTDAHKGIVRFPRRIVEKHVATAPEKIELYNRGGTLCAELGTGKSYTASGHNAIYILEHGSRERRNATKKDVGNFALLSDYLQDIDVIGIEAMPQDVQPESTLIHAVDAAFSNTDKPVFFSPERAEVVKPIFDIARVVTGRSDLSSKPPFICQLSPTSPLTWEEGAVEALVATVEEGVPLCLLPQPFAGVTSPYTLAGHLTIHNAETLSGAVLGQLINPGSPIIYGSAWSTFDMRQANVLIGSPETVLMRIAGAQLAELYHLPHHTIAPDTDAHVMDEQLSWEKFATTWGSFLGQADLIVNGGMFSTGLTVSFEQLVIDNEIFSYIKRLSRGILVDEDTLALDTIERVGPKGDYLGEEHTLRYLKSGEHWEPLISTREIYENWQREGRKDIVEKAHEKVQWILKNHKVAELSDRSKEDIQAIIKGFEGSY